MRLVIDENISMLLINQLTDYGFSVYSIQKHNFGISDREVTTLASHKGDIIITSDKDFGELVFASRITNISVVLLRMEPDEINQIYNKLIFVLREDNPQLFYHFTTITKDRIRVRKI